MTTTLTRSHPHPAATSKLCLNKISSVFTCCLIIIITSYSANYSRFLSSMFYFFETLSFDDSFFRDFCFRALVTIPSFILKFQAENIIPELYYILRKKVNKHSRSQLLNSRVRALPLALN